MQKNISFKFDFIIYAEKIDEFLNLDSFSFSHSINSENNEELNKFTVHKTPNSWSLKSEPYYSYFLLESLQLFLESSKLKNCEFLLDFVPPYFEIKLFVKSEIFNGETMPSLSLDTELLNFLHANNCSIDIDLYDYRNKR